MKLPRHWSPLLLATTLATVATGCVVSIGGHESTPPRRTEVPKPSPVVVVPGNLEDSATLAEIDAVAKLNFENARLDGFRAVAHRAGISPGVQVHLVNTALRALDFDTGKVEILQALIRNPSFGTPAKEAIFRQLDCLSFDNSKTTVLHAIQERPTTP